MIKRMLRRMKPIKQGKRMTREQVGRNTWNLFVFGIALLFSIGSFRLHDWFWGVVLMLIALLWCNRSVLGDWPDLKEEPVEEDKDKTPDLRKRWKDLD